MGPGGLAPPASPRRVHARYADGLPVFDGDEPPRISGPDPLAAGRAHSVIRWDWVNGRIYQLREFDARGWPVRDVDFTNPTYPSGHPRRAHPGPPHQHRWVMVDPKNPHAGFRRGVAFPLP
jgi:hypothetical protein